MGKKKDFAHPTGKGRGFGLLGQAKHRDFAHPTGRGQGGSFRKPRADNFAHASERNRTSYRPSNDGAVSASKSDIAGFHGEHPAATTSKAANKLGTKEYSHRNHTTLAADQVGAIKLIIYVSIMFSAVLSIAALYTDATVKANAISGVVTASSIFLIVIFVATYEALHYFITHGIGKPEGRKF